MTVLDFFFFFFLSMQFVAGKVQKQIKTLHLQTAVETVFSPCKMKQNMTEGCISLLFKYGNNICFKRNSKCVQFFLEYSYNCFSWSLSFQVFD